MNRTSTMAAIAALALSGLTASASAAGITLDPNTVNFFRDNRGTNDVGIGSGDFWQFGANITAGSGGTSVFASYPAGNFTTGTSACSPLAVNRNFCSGSTRFNASRLGDWSLTFNRAGDPPLTVAAPSTVPTNVVVPFPSNVTITGNGVNPTISWQLPANYLPDGFRIQIFDKSGGRSNGSADIIYSTAVANNATSLTIPTNLGGGRQLVVGGNYSINFQVVETRDNLPFNNNNFQILSRSNSFFSFTPQPPNVSGPPLVFLPEVTPDTNLNDDRGPVYSFRIEGVGPNSVTFVDPVVAVGYDYAVALGDPNFASVILPSVGDGLFDLSYLLSGLTVHQSLSAGQQFFFQPGGVSAFSVRGIETSAGLDPNDAAAFVTGLTFVSAGNFNGTMTAIVADVPVPLPATFGLVLAGLLGWAGIRRPAIARNGRRSVRF